MSRRRARASGEGTLSYRAGKGLWVGRLPRAIDPQRRPHYGKTQKEALDKLREARRNAERGLAPLSEGYKTGAWLDKWLDLVRDRVAAGVLAASTAAGYERAVRRHIIPALGPVPLRKLAPGHVEKMFTRMQAARLDPQTVRHARAILSRALSDAMREELIVRNVARLVEPPRVEARHPSAFSVEEFRRIVTACETHRLGPLFLFIAGTGVRRSEALALRRRDVDLDAGSYAVRESLHQLTKASERVVGRSGLIAGRPKTDASAKPLPLSASAVALLREHLRRQTKERLKSRNSWPNEPDNTHVFASETGGPLTPSNVSRAWRELLKRSNVPHRKDGRPRGLHELRRTFATRLRDAGVPLEDVRRLGRWASTQMLLDVYSASDSDRLRRAADAASNILDG